MSIFGHIKKIFQTTPTREAQLDKELMSRETLLYPTALFTPYNPDTLASRKGGLRIYDKIRRDDTVKGCMNLRKFAVLCSGWVVEPASDDEADIEVAEFVKHNLERVKGTFEDVLLNIMTAFDYGFSVSEKVYTLLPGTEPYGGKVGVKAIKTRKPHGVDFDVDEFGNLRKNGVWQGFGTRKLPPNKFIIYTYRKEFDNWYGVSDLREAYRAWWSKDVIIKLYNIYLERYSMPPAVGTLKKALTKNERTTLKNILDNLQARTSIVLPDGVELDFPEVSGRGASTYKDAIAVHDMAIARSLLIPNLLGVSEQGHYGSYSQGKVHFDVFLQIVDKHRRDLEEVLNEQLVRELVSFNYAVDKYPKFKFRPMDEEKRQAMAKLFIDAVEKGVISPTLKDENKLRQHLGWPEREEEEGGYQLRSYTTYFRPLSPYEKKCQFERIQRYLDQLDRNSVEKITGVIKQQRDWLIDFVSKRMGKGELRPTLIQKLELKYGGKLQEVITEMLRLAFYEGRKEVEREIGKKHYKRLNPFAPTAALEWLKSKGIQTKEILNSQLRFKVQNILMESLKKGIPLKETIQKIQQAYQPYVGDPAVLVPGAVTPYSIEKLVRTNTTAAYNHGRVSMMQQAGDYVPAMEFSAILDSRTTEICRKADGKVIPKNDPDMERFIPPLHHNCFLSPKTPVLTDKGYKPIKDIKLGDKVLTHLGRYMPVTFVHHRQAPTTYKGLAYKVILDIGTGTITLPPVTPDHPVLATPGWVPVKRLEVGDRITVWQDGGFVTAVVIAVGTSQMKYHQRLYNLSVEGDESYVVNGVVVHNCRSLLIPVTRDDMMTHPFTPITRQEKDELLALIPEEFGGRVGGPSSTPPQYVVEEVVDRLGESALEIGKSKGVEVAYLVDMEEGRQVGKVLVGGKSVVKFDEETIALMENPKRKLVGIHNHPGSASFSAQDVYLFCQSQGIRRMVVYGHDGTKYVMEKKVGIDYTSVAEEAFYSWGAERDTLMDKYESRWKAGEDEWAIWKDHTHEIMQKVSKRYNFRYYRVLPGGKKE